METKTVKLEKLKADNEFRKELGPQSLIETAMLKMQITCSPAECRVPLDAWQANGELVLIDGYHRARLYEEMGVDEAEVVVHDFKDRGEALTFIRARQAGRRNLRGRRWAYILGRLYGSKRPEGWQCGNNTEAWAKEFAEEYGVTQKEAQRALALSIAIDKMPGKLTEAYLNNEFKISRGDMALLTEVLRKREDRKEVIDGLLADPPTYTVDELLERKGEGAKAIAWKKLKAVIGAAVRKCDEAKGVSRGADRATIAKVMKHLEGVVKALDMDDPLGSKSEKAAEAAPESGGE